MKKIFGLFAMAALATTGLTCCGGGGGGEDSHAYRTYTFDGPMMRGVMQVRVMDQMDGVDGKYNATISFSVPNTRTYSGYFLVTQKANTITSTNQYEDGKQPVFDQDNNLVEDGVFKSLDTTEQIVVGIYSNSEGNDNAMVNFFQDFVENVNEDDDDNGDVNVESPPKPILNLKYAPNGRSGDYMMTIETEVEVTQKDKEGNEKTVKTLKPANLGPYNFTVTY